MTVPLITSTVSNPFTGTFGNGVIVPFLNSTTFYVPAGVDSVRVRVWGGGGYNTGAGGGFSMRTITGLISGTAIVVTVGASGISGSTTGGTSSFGSYLSATGGGSGGSVGSGTGGDINTSGGTANAPSGGGVAGMFGNGGTGSSGDGGSGNAGGGGGSTAGNISGNGIFGTGGMYQSTTVTIFPTSGFISTSIDFIGTGGGGPNKVAGINGGGGSNAAGGFPGGGGGAGSNGGKGLVIVEY